MPQFTHLSMDTVGLDFNKLLIKNKNSTFLFRYKGGRSCKNLQNKDILIVDRSLIPQNGDLILDISKDNFQVIEFNHQICEIWGVITFIVHEV